jgi:hypothetical protein
LNQAQILNLILFNQEDRKLRICLTPSSHKMTIFTSLSFNYPKATAFANKRGMKAFSEENAFTPRIACRLWL